jgi:hypothetical protein
MTGVNNKLLKLMSILDEQAKLHPKGTAVQVKSEQLVDCPDYAPLLDKLEKEHRVIIIEQRPDSKGYAKADHDMFSWEYPKDYERYMSYFVTLKPIFDDFYKAEYTKHRSTTAILTDNNRVRVKPKISFANSNAKKNGVMTGKEKIQAVIEAINDEYRGLITGNVVTIYSGHLGQKGLSFDEQKQVLDTLANDEKVIKYFAKKQYESRADIHLRDQVDVFEGSMDSLEADEAFDVILAQLEYRVEVLSGFDELAEEVLGNAELQSQQDVYLLKLLYNRIIAILDAVVANGVIIEDDELDFVYVHLLAHTDNLLDKPQMKKWKDAAPEIYETIMGNAEDIGEGWQYSRTEVLKYYAKIQKDWMLHNKTEFEVSDEVPTVFEQVDEHIERYKKLAKQASENWLNRADRFAKDFRKGKVIINKESKPKPDYPDDTASVRDEEPIRPDIQEDIPSEPKKQSKKVLFDTKTSTLIFGNAKCDIPDETLEYYICRFTFKNRQVAAKEDDILEKSVKSQDSQRAVYDAMLRVNKKAKDTLGLEKLLVYKAAKLRINKKYQ